MKTKENKIVKEKQKRQPIAFTPKEVVDNRCTVRVQKYGYEYVLKEAIDRPLHLPTPSFMGRSGFVLHKFRKLRLYPTI